MTKGMRNCDATGPANTHTCIQMQTGARLTLPSMCMSMCVCVYLLLVDLHFMHMIMNINFRARTRVMCTQIWKGVPFRVDCDLFPYVSVQQTVRGWRKLHGLRLGGVRSSSVNACSWNRASTERTKHATHIISALTHPHKYYIQQSLYI